MKNKRLFLILISISFIGLLSSCKDLEILQHALEETTIPGAEYVGSETCVVCHEKESKDFKLSTHERIAIPLEKNGKVTKVEGCEMCHGAGSLHVDGGGGKGNHIINPSRDPKACMACHTDKEAQLKMPFHHPILEGRMSCTDCHSPHGQEVRPWSAVSVENINEACFKCHKDQRGPFVIEHPALREGCTTCHDVHGSINDKMLISRDVTLCLKCHTQQNWPTLGNSGHTTRTNAGACWSSACHVAVHGSNFDDHLRN